MCEIYVKADPMLYESRSRSLRIHGGVTKIRLENHFWDILAEIAARNTHFARVHRRIGAVLECDGQVAVAAVCDVFRRIRVARGAFHKDKRHIRFNNFFHKCRSR